MSSGNKRRIRKKAERRCLLSALFFEKGLTRLDRIPEIPAHQHILLFIIMIPPPQTATAPISTQAKANCAGSNHTRLVPKLPPSDLGRILNMTIASSSDAASGRAAMGKPPAELRPVLPLDVFGHALDYVPYGDVQSALAVSKTVRSEASKAVKVLNFTRGAQLGHRSSGRCFPNVVEVNCFSFARKYSTVYSFFTVEICDVTRDRIVVFLSTFPKLRRVFIGGFDDRIAGRQGRDVLVRRRLNGTLKGAETSMTVEIRRFFNQLLSSLQSDLLPPSLEFLDGVNEMLLGPRRFCHVGRYVCSHCTDMCTHMPIVNALTWPCRCKDRIVYYEAVACIRQGASEMFRHNKWRGPFERSLGCSKSLVFEHWALVGGRRRLLSSKNCFVLKQRLMTLSGGLASGKLQTLQFLASTS